jgi:hypothetical protein
MASWGSSIVWSHITPCLLRAAGKKVPCHARTVGRYSAENLHDGQKKRRKTGVALEPSGLLNEMAQDELAGR